MGYPPPASQRYNLRDLWPFALRRSARGRKSPPHAPCRGSQRQADATRQAFSPQKGADRHRFSAASQAVLPNLLLWKGNQAQGSAGARNSGTDNCPYPAGDRRYWYKQPRPYLHLPALAGSIWRSHHKDSPTARTTCHEAGLSPKKGRQSQTDPLQYGLQDLIYHVCG